MLSREQLQQAAADSGFQVEAYEKVHVLTTQDEREHRVADHELSQLY